ncbi:efflux RND transporter periplasmic adaptor subunit [Oceanobacter mangrovi]|uniref:efflux RND transporter periplasmic adaptor subunit n=1 Tax=Oceanobacter mangrovi TaxID=2862510 RepID=UPI0024847EAD|nr:efflux RND transporter periplasmic adaptor subunit [Oceanobacter mangrovi]
MIKSSARTLGHLCASLAVVVLLAGCQSESDGNASAAGQQRPAPEVSYIEVQPQAVTLTSELKGRTVASMSSEIRPQVGGIVRKRLFEEGSAVKAGEVLYQIDPASYEAAVRQAKADLNSAEASVQSTRLTAERYAELVKIEGVSQQDADDAKAAWLQARASVESAKAALETARINLGYTRVTAPIAGRIGLSSVTPGALVSASQDTALATINTLDPMYVDMTQSSSDLLKLRKMIDRNGLSMGGADVSLLLEDGSTYEQTGTLKVREVAVDSDTGSVTLRAEFPNPDGILLPGMFVRAVISDAEDDQAIVVPQQGIARDIKGNAVAMVLSADNKVEQRIVTTERAIKNQWLVSNGLQAGDRLIVEGTSKISVGMAVRPVAATVKDDGSVQLGLSGKQPSNGNTDDHNAELASE